MGRDFEGRVAIVTGSAKGIGAATALALASQGAKVVVNYNISKDSAEATLDLIRKVGAEALAVQGNVAEEADCQRIFDTAFAAWGRVDILVNNAGTTKFADHRDVAALSPADFAEIYAVNVTGAYSMTKVAFAALQASGDGAIVNISSIAGLYGVGSSVAYAASKGALNTMTYAMARAYAPQIRVNAVCPGFVATDWFGSRFGAEAAVKITALQRNLAPLKRTAGAEDIAKAVCFLAGPNASCITGETLLVDAGLHLGGDPAPH
ncbi:MAG: glucose 1-dehydrogenase [Rhizomicrobium sp.]|nr:glucose 1-dehydrogenase [Rhizomicrobium sp.]